jgi:lipoprotein-anchoring transpeptidase ErfK/SrfK
LGVLVAAFAQISAAAALDMQQVNGATWTSTSRTAKSRTEPLVIKAEVLLDRARYSPGEIDGKPGENFQKALSAFAMGHGLQPSAQLNEEIWRELSAQDEEPVLTAYKLLKDDVEGPFVPNIPKRMEEMKDLPSLGYTSAREKIAEKFHMSEQLLQALNPGQKFEQPDQEVVVTNFGRSDDSQSKVARIDIDKARQILRTFDREGKQLDFYPITAGSTEKPAPDGRLKVTAVSKNPTYRYNPKYHFKDVKTNEPFTIKAGPNNPVGLVWIGLSKEGYGIHGTPDPSKIGKSESHGCIRLTNWDALELAASVSKGIPVDFHGDEKDPRHARVQAPRKLKRH